MIFPSELTQKEIVKKFNENSKLDEITLYSCYIGEYTKFGRKSSSTQYGSLLPQAVKISRKKDGEIVDTFGQMNDLLADLGDKYANGLFSHRRNNGNQNPLYPSDTVTHIEWYLHFDFGDMQVDNQMIEKIKFFEKIEDAELHFIFMLNSYMKRNGLDEAVRQYNKLFDKHSVDNPDQILKIIGD